MTYRQRKRFACKIVRAIQRVDHVHIHCEEDVPYEWLELSHDCKELALSRFHRHYGVVFNELDRRFGLFDSLEVLSIDTDHRWQLPMELHKFKRLRRLCISGSRWFGVTMKQIPRTVEIVQWSSSNLNERWHDGLEHMQALQQIVFHIAAWDFPRRCDRKFIESKRTEPTADEKRKFAIHKLPSNLRKLVLKPDSDMAHAPKMTDIQTSLLFYFVKDQVEWITREDLSFTWNIHFRRQPTE